MNKWNVSVKRLVAGINIFIMTITNSWAQNSNLFPTLQGPGVPFVNDPSFKYNWASGIGQNLGGGTMADTLANCFSGEESEDALKLFILVTNDSDSDPVGGAADTWLPIPVEMMRNYLDQPDDEAKEAWAQQNMTEDQRSMIILAQQRRFIQALLHTYNQIAENNWEATKSDLIRPLNPSSSDFKENIRRRVELLLMSTEMDSITEKYENSQRDEEHLDGDMIKPFRLRTDAGPFTINASGEYVENSQQPEWFQLGVQKLNKVPDDTFMNNLQYRKITLRELNRNARVMSLGLWGAHAKAKAPSGTISSAPTKLKTTDEPCYAAKRFRSKGHASRLPKMRPAFNLMEFFYLGLNKVLNEFLRVSPAYAQTDYDSVDFGDGPRSWMASANVGLSVGLGALMPSGFYPLIEAGPGLSVSQGFYDKGYGTIEQYEDTFAMSISTQLGISLGLGLSGASLLKMEFSNNASGILGWNRTPYYGHYGGGVSLNTSIFLGSYSFDAEMMPQCQCTPTLPSGSSVTVEFLSGSCFLECSPVSTIQAPHPLLMVSEGNLSKWTLSELRGLMARIPGFYPFAYSNEGGLIGMQPEEYNYLQSDGNADHDSMRTQLMTSNYERLFTHVKDMLSPGGDFERLKRPEKIIWNDQSEIANHAIGLALASYSFGLSFPTGSAGLVPRTFGREYGVSASTVFYENFYEGSDSGDGRNYRGLKLMFSWVLGLGTYVLTGKIKTAGAAMMIPHYHAMKLAQVCNASGLLAAMGHGDGHSYRICNYLDYNIAATYHWEKAYQVMEQLWAQWFPLSEGLSESKFPWGAIIKIVFSNYFDF